MIRLLAMIGVVALLAVLLQSAALRRLLVVFAAALILYALLKLTGVVDAAKPDAVGMGYHLTYLVAC